MGRILIEPDKCPRCGCVPMIWTTPNGMWYVGCSNNSKHWHEIIQAMSVNSRHKAIKNWNELVEELWIQGVTRKRHNERRFPEDAPYWIENEDGIFFHCSNCGYTLTPRQEICPSCLKRMRPWPLILP